MKRLLIVACSAKKNPDPRPLPALERYQGAYYQMIKQVPADKLPQIIILSAKYGFIDSQALIADYNQQMDSTRAAALQIDGSCYQQWKKLVTGTYDEVFIAAGEKYRRVILWYLYSAQLGSTVIRVARGGIGEQRKQLKEWLAKGA